MISIRTIFQIMFATAVVTIPFATVAYPESLQRECRAAKQFARLLYDRRLTLTVVEDDDVDACFFQVTLPVADNSSPAATAAAMVQEARLGKIEALSLTSPILNALSAPLDSKAFISPAYTRLISRLREQPDTISTCAEKFLFQNAGVVQVDDTISCGVEVKDGQSVFILAAKLEGVTATFQVPVST